MSRLFMRYPGFKMRALTLSYDDGVSADRRLIEIMTKHGIKGTFNINSGSFGQGKRMPAEELLPLYRDSGMEVAVHGLHHPFWNKIPRGVASYDIVTDRNNLEKLFGRIIRGAAYPFGATSEGAVSVLSDAGIVYCRTTVSTERFDLPTDWLRMPATCHHGNPRLFELCDRFLSQTPKYNPALFYLWGHSYEFDDNGNWDVIERFCEKMGGRDDIWYATNIEIYEYVQDYQRLEFSVRGDRIYNPSARTLWIFLGKEKGVISIAPGETVLLED